MRAKPEMKPWVHTEEKYDELRRSGTHSERLVCVVAIRGLAFVEKVLLMRSLKNVWDQLTQGLRPGLCRSVALAGLFDVPPSSLPKINSFVILMGLLFVVYACVVSVLSHQHETF